MSASLTLEGLYEFIKELGQVPVHVEKAGQQVIDKHAGRLAEQLRAELPQRTGELASTVQWRSSLTRPLEARVWYGEDDGRELGWADAYEKGSPPRQTQRAANRGRAPKARAMAKRAGKVRRQMNRELAHTLTEALRKL